MKTRKPALRPGQRGHTLLFCLATVFLLSSCFDDIEQGPIPESAGGTTGGAGGLAAPTGVTADGGDEQVNIAWNLVAGATQYNIYWRMQVGGVTTSDNFNSNGTSPYNPIAGS